MLYPSRESGVQYKGIRSAPYMIRFIRKFMNPIIRVNSDKELMKLIKSYDVSFNYPDKSFSFFFFFFFLLLPAAYVV